MKFYTNLLEIGAAQLENYLENSGLVRRIRF